MSDLSRTPAEQQRVHDAIVDLFEHRITFNQQLGLSVDQLETQSVVAGFHMRPELVGHFRYGRLHGGVISAVLDTTGGLAVMWGITERHAGDPVLKVLERFAPLSTVDLRIDYLRQGLGERFVAKSHVVKLGRRIANTQMSLENEEGTLIATGVGTYVVS